MGGHGGLCGFGAASTPAVNPHFSPRSEFSCCLDRLECSKEDKRLAGVGFFPLHHAGGCSPLPDPGKSPDFEKKTGRPATGCGRQTPSKARKGAPWGEMLSPPPGSHLYHVLAGPRGVGVFGLPVRFAKRTPGILPGARSASTRGEQLRAYPKGRRNTHAENRPFLRQPCYSRGRERTRRGNTKAGVHKAESLFPATRGPRQSLAGGSQGACDPAGLGRCQRLGGTFRDTGS